MQGEDVHDAKNGSGNPAEQPRPCAVRRPSVGFLGPMASYSHQAVLQVFPREKWELRPAATITDVFDQVQSAQVSVGVVPFENSSNGCVEVTLDNLAGGDGRFKHLVVDGEIYVNVNHCLIGRRGSGGGAKADTIRAASPRDAAADRLQHVRQLYSHPQAFGQCRTFLSASLKGAEHHEVSSTSKAAEIVSKQETDTAAAISNELAASVYGLQVLAKAIQDCDDNVTRFLIIRRRRDPAQAPGIADQPTSADADTRKHAGEPSPGSKSLVSFTVSHDSPGSLADVLGCFKEHGFNLTSINTRPTRLAPFQYVFFVEFEGHMFGAEGRVERVLKKLSQLAESSRWLGSWSRER